VTDPSQSPEPSDEAQISDVPAAPEPDAPVVSHPVLQQPASAESAVSPSVAASPDWSPPAAGPETVVTGAAEDRPELAIGAAFAGGLVLALILKRLAR
jgi:hypothetical protein